MKNNAQKVHGYSYLKLFMIFVVLLTVGFMTYRAVDLYRQRSFLTDSYITLYTNGEDNFLVSYHSPKSYTVAQLYNTPNLSPSRSSLLQLSLTLGVPIDAVVIDPELKSPRQIFSLLSTVKMLFFPHSFSLRNMNAFDSFKLFLLARGASDGQRNDTSLDYSSISEEQLADLFRDEEIFNNAVSVEIMNGTEIGGLGGEFSSVLTSRGYNVVAVTNSQTTENNSYMIVRSRKESQAAKSLSHILRVDKNSDVGEVADITIVLGRDVAR